MRCSTVATALVAVFVSYLGTPAAVKAGGYIETDLVADVNPLIDKNGISHTSQIQDQNLLNSWGLTSSPTSPFWVSDNNAGVSTLYNVAPGGKSVSKVGLTVSIPTCSDPSGHSGAPTGTVFNITTLPGSTPGFTISGVKGDGVTETSAPARFLFATEDGTIVGWNPGVFSPGKTGMTSTFGIIAVPENCASPVNASYKGLAIATTSGGAFLYAANFQTGMVDMYDTNFHVVNSFTDPKAGEAFHPFNVVVIDDKLYVTFAVRNPHTGNNVPGKGSGIVSVFNLDGTFDKQFADGGHLKAPWGMALVPSSNFGPLAGTLWIGNFGDGHINAFDPTSGAFIDQVRDSSGNPIVIDGLWALRVGTATTCGTNTVCFTAGPNDEKDGLLGSLNPN
jgi:uncharacterized protein (TIGR03118 family)